MRFLFIFAILATSFVTHGINAAQVGRGKYQQQNVQEYRPYRPHRHEDHHPETQRHDDDSNSGFRHLQEAEYLNGDDGERQQQYLSHDRQIRRRPGPKRFGGHHAIAPFPPASTYDRDDDNEMDYNNGNPEGQLKLSPLSFYYYPARGRRSANSNSDKPPRRGWPLKGSKDRDAFKRFEKNGEKADSK